MNRTRKIAAVLAVAGALTATQLGVAGAASASTAAKASAATSVGCPIDIVYTSKFYVNSGGWVTGDGLYFGLKNKSGSTFKNVTFTVTDVKNIRFGTGKATGGRVSHRTSTWISVNTSKLKGKASLGVRVHTHLLNTRSYKVKFTVHGSGWNCAVNQGTWGV